EDDPARADSPRSSAATASPSELAIMKAIGDGLAKLLAKSKGDDKAYKSSQWPSLSKRLEKIDMSSMDKSLIRQTALDEVDRNSLSLFEKEIWYFSDDQKDQSFGGFIRALLSWLWVALLEGAAFGDVYSHVYHCISAAGYKSPLTGRMAGTLVAAQYDAQMRKEAGCSMSMSWSMDDKNYVSVRKACSGLARFDANRLILLIGKASADSHQKNNYGQGNHQNFRGKKRSYSDDAEEVWKKINGKWIKVSGGKASGSYEDKHKSKKAKAGQDSKKEKASDGKSADWESPALTNSLATRGDLTVVGALPRAAGNLAQLACPSDRQACLALPELEESSKDKESSRNLYFIPKASKVGAGVQPKAFRDVELQASLDHLAPSDHRKQALASRHPLSDAPGLPISIVASIHCQRRLAEAGPENVITQREKVMEYWQNCHTQMRDDFTPADGEIEQLTSRLNLPLFQRMLEASGYPDVSLPADLARGLDLVGSFKVADGVFRENPDTAKRVAVMSASELLSDGVSNAHALAERVSREPCPFDGVLWKKALEEVRDGTMAGPHSLEQLQSIFGGSFVASRRFG
ncbi:hypothetical protein FOZ62_004056, partial [Perkinsus olseni]